MVSPELLRRYPFFGGLDMHHIKLLAQIAQEASVDEGTYFFREGDELNIVYLLVEGEVDILMEIPEKQMATVTSKIPAGEVFGWSGLLPPYEATAAARAQRPCHVVVFDAQALRAKFEEDRELAFFLIQQTALVIRERLNALRIESLAYADLKHET